MQETQFEMFSSLRQLQRISLMNSDTFMNEDEDKDEVENDE